MVSGSGGFQEGSEADAAALVERLRGPRAVQLLPVVDVTERIDAAVRRRDVERRKLARREFRIGGCMTTVN